MPALLFATDRKYTEASVHGHVLDRNTGEHVPFLVVSLKGTTVGTTTGDTGHYFLEHLPEGTVVPFQDTTRKGICSPVFLSST